MKRGLHISIITTYRCNARCGMCNIWKYPTSNEEEFKPEILNKLPNNIWRINLTGGEPMLREDIFDIADILYKKTKIIELSTNGFYTDKIVEFANRYYKKLLIRVSIEGLPRLNDSLRGTKDGFDHAIRTMLELKRSKAKDIGFGVVISDKNIYDLKYIYDLSVYLDVDLGCATLHNSWYFHKYDNTINNPFTTAELHKDYIVALLKSRRNKLNKRIKDWGRAFFNRSINRYIQGEKHFRPPCVGGRDMFFIDPWGKVLPCNGSAEPWIMGDLNNQSWDEIMNSVQSKEILEKVKNCTNTCVFIGTERFIMKRKPWIPIIWILKNKYRLLLNKDIILY